MRSPLLGCVAAALALGVFAVTPALAQEACPQPCQSDCGEAGCGESGCEPQCCLCDPGCPGLIGGAEWTILRPHFRNNTALTTIDTSVAGVTANTANAFNHHYNSSPRLWLGYVNGHGFGGRVRYWFFDHSASDELFVATATRNAAIGEIRTNAAGQTMGVISNIRAYTLDFDTMQRLDAGHWKMNLGGGLRNASIAQNYGALVSLAGVPLAGLDVRHRFDGLGPTVFAELKRPIGRTSISFVANARGSYLYGDSGFQAIQGIFGGAPPVNVWTDTHQASSIAIGDLQIGAEWAKNLGSADLVAQLLWEGQYWQGTGNAVNPNGDDMGLMGFTFQLGLTR